MVHVAPMLYANTICLMNLKNFAPPPVFGKWNKALCCSEQGLKRSYTWLYSRTILCDFLRPSLTNSVPLLTSTASLDQSTRLLFRLNTRTIAWECSQLTMLHVLCLGQYWTYANYCPALFRVTTSSCNSASLELLFKLSSSLVDRFSEAVKFDEKGTTICLLVEEGRVKWF